MNWTFVITKTLQKVIPLFYTHPILSACMRWETFVIELKLGWRASCVTDDRNIYSSFVACRCLRTKWMESSMRLRNEEQSNARCDNNNSRLNGRSCPIHVRVWSIPCPFHFRHDISSNENYNSTINKSKSLLLCQQQWWFIILCNGPNVNQNHSSPLWFSVTRVYVDVSEKRKLNQFRDFHPLVVGRQRSPIRSIEMSTRIFARLNN